MYLWTSALFAVGLAVSMLYLLFGICSIAKSNRFIKNNVIEIEDFNSAWNLIKCICWIFIHGLNQVSSIIFIVYWYYNNYSYFIIVVCVVILYRFLSSTLHFIQLYTFEFNNFFKYFLSYLLNLLLDIHFFKSIFNIIYIIYNWN